MGGINAVETSHNAVVFAIAFVSAVVCCWKFLPLFAAGSFCRHSERSEESRGSRPTIAFQSFPA
jgi:hypothetical protein